MSWFKKNDISNRFEKLILSMYKEFPNGRVDDSEIRKVVITEKDVQMLRDQGFIYREREANTLSERTWKYALGPNSIPLIVSLRTEQFTQKIHRLTDFMVFVTVLLFLVAVIQILITIISLTS